jgi:hypothetical protein
LSTAYHLQTDGQTERTNWTLKIYLKIFSNAKQDNWSSLLLIAQLAYNNKLLEAISTTLYFANYRTHLNLFIRTLLHLKVEAAVKIADELRRVHLELCDKLLNV